jgi:hypothetical protein
MLRWEERRASVSGGIYLVQGGDLVEMAEQDYASEARLQELLAKYPNLLAGDQIDGDEPRRWLLLERELSLATEEGGTGRWSVDHLFLDQDAVPTIVEVKRSTDTRVRREVVGQVLDYAANAVVYWPLETLRARFEEGRDDPEQELMVFWTTSALTLRYSGVRSRPIYRRARFVLCSWRTRFRSSCAASWSSSTGR